MSLASSLSFARSLANHSVRSATSVKSKGNRALTVALAATVLSGVAGCAHHRDVRAGEDGINRVILKSEDKDGSYRQAHAQAEDYCEQSHRSPVIITEGTKYSGDMDEDNYNTGKQLSKVAQMAGGAVFVLGGKNESQAGSAVGVGGGIANSALGSGYTYEMKFKCR